ncbi:MAG: YdcF family protein [Proteobacteria bacterium]|nr:YdcF family protein [Pseudomonadota bacterium]
MSAGWLFNTVAGSLLLPPFSFVCLCALGLLLRRKWPRTGMTLAWLSLALLTLFSTRPGAMLVARPLEAMHAPLLVPEHAGAQAIVVLGGGRQANAPEYGGGDEPNLRSLARVRYGARLQRVTGLPILVSGGAPEGAARSEAALMASVLKTEFGVPVRWVEGASDNTAQNAYYSATLLRQAGIRRIILVTDAMHMARAYRSFTAQGLDVVPAPTMFYSQERGNAADWLPAARWLHVSDYALHEWLGRLWYALR